MFIALQMIMRQTISRHFMIKAFRGTNSLPFDPGKHIELKIIDDRGIESLKIITR